MVFDILFLVFIGLGFWQGYRNGVVHTLFSIVGLFLGIIAALKFSYLAVNLLHGWLDLGPKALVIVAFILVVLMVVLLFMLIAWGLEQILKALSLNLPNKIIGGLLHALMSLYFLCVCIWFLNKMNVFPQSQKQHSHVYPYIGNAAPKVVEVTGKVIPFFKDAFENFDKLFAPPKKGSVNIER